MIIWSGFGFVVPIIAVVGLIIAQVSVDAIMGEKYLLTHGWSQLAALSLVSVALWFSGKWLNRPTGKVLIDAETGEEFYEKGNSAFFFIPVQYWAVVSILAGVVMAFSS